MSARAYLDWNATTPLLPEAREAMLRAMDIVGNPSSIHSEGRAARALLEAARADVAALVGGEAENVVFTSGATEAAQALLQLGLTGCCGRDIACAMPNLIGATEHAALIAGQAAETLVMVDADGVINREALADRLAAQGPSLVFIQLGNNETGVIQPIDALAEQIHGAGGALVVDAVQGPGKLDLDIKALGADALFISGHKFGGPKGVGAMVFTDSRTRLASALVQGGGQERGQRGGTENLSGIVGIGAAARVASASSGHRDQMLELRDHFNKQLKRLSPDSHIVGQKSPRLVNTSCFAIPGIRSEAALIALDLDGIALSSGSACSSGKVKASHVLKAMGEPDWVQAGALRLSIGPTTTMAEIERCLISLEKIIMRRKNVAPAA